MKIASYILFVLAGLACVVVAVSFLASDVRARLAAWKHGGVVQQQENILGTDLAPLSAQSGSVNDDRIVQLESRLSSLQSVAQDLSQRVVQLESQLSDIQARPVATGSTISQGPVAATIPVSPLLSMKMPAVEFVASGEKDLFGLSLFSGLRFTTYRDRQFEARWYFFDEDYASVKRNLVASSAFQINETNTFFGKSSFVNLKPADGFVRVIFDVSGKAVALEIVKERYESLKKLLLK